MNNGVIPDPSLSKAPRGPESYRVNVLLQVERDPKGPLGRQRERGFMDGGDPW